MKPGDRLYTEAEIQTAENGTEGVYTSVTPYEAQAWLDAWLKGERWSRGQASNQESSRS